MTSGLSRRSLLKLGGGAALGVGLGAGRLPAWARSPARAAQGLGPGALPNPRLPEGTPTMPRIEHIVVLMMENQSFDGVLGMLPTEVPARRRVVFSDAGYALRDPSGKPTGNIVADSARWEVSPDDGREAWVMMRASVIGNDCCCTDSM